MVLKLLFAYLVSLIVLCDASTKNAPKKPFDIGVFLDDDDQFELSTLAVISVVEMAAKKTSYAITPHINKTSKSEILETGLNNCRLIEEGIVATFGPQSPEINAFIQSVSTSLEIPQFQTFWNPALTSFSSSSGRKLPDKSIPVFNLFPSPHTLSKALATLVRENEWKTFTVIYENDDGLLRLQEVLKQRNPTDPAISFRKLGSKETYRWVLKEIKNSLLKQIILDCEVDHILDILREAREQKLLSEFHSYILTNLDTHTLDWSEFQNIKTNITSLRLLDPKSSAMSNAVFSWNRILQSSIFDVVKDNTLRNALINFKRNHPFLQINVNQIRTKTALLYDALNLFISTYHHLDSQEEIISESLSCYQKAASSHGYRFAEALTGKKVINQSLLLEPLTGPITKFDQTGFRQDYQLQIVELDVNKFVVTGTWEPKNPNEINDLLTSEQRNIGYKRKSSDWNFRVVSRLGDPYLMKKTVITNRNDMYEGHAIDLMKHICAPKNLNCTFTFQLVRDGLYGNYNPQTKQWNGLIKDLLDNKADLAVGDLTITYERKRAVDFTVPFMTLGISILYAKPVKEPQSLLAFSHPLSLDVWLYVATAYLIISLIIFLVARLNPDDWENPHPCNTCPQELENIWSIRNCCWLTLGSIMAQGCDILPKGVSTRFVAAVWWFFVLIMINCYTANMTAFLTTQRMGLTITSADDLAEQAKIKYGCLEGGATASFFKDTNFSTYHRMWVQMESADPSVFESNNKEGVKRVIASNGKYAFLMESSSIEYETERNCGLMQVGNNLDSKGYGIAMPTNAPYRKIINEAILKMQESGDLHKLKNKWWKEKNGGGQCKKDKSSDDDPSANELGLDHVGGVFIVLAIGMCLAVIIAVFEFLWNVRKVAVVEHLTPKQAFFKELNFAVNIKARRKAVLKCSPSAAVLLEQLEE